MEREGLLEIRNLDKSYGKHKVVKDLHLTVQKGDIFGFLGPNGAGKTTTIRMILGLVHPDRGTVKINGLDLKQDFKTAISQVGSLVETPCFYSYLTGYANLKLMANLYPGLPKSRIDEVLDIVGLTKRSKDKVKTYSLGMKQRLGVARALLNHPKLVILDEPTNGLDPQGMREVRETISQLALEQDITFFISTHLLNEVEQICNRVAILNQGQLVTEGEVSRLLDRNFEVIEIRSSSPDKATDLLQEFCYVKSIEQCASGLLVELDKGHTNELNRLLISHDIDVNYLIPRDQSLEQYFIDITEGGNLHD